MNKYLLNTTLCVCFIAQCIPMTEVVKRTLTISKTSDNVMLKAFVFESTTTIIFFIYKNLKKNPNTSNNLNTA